MEYLLGLTNNSLNIHLLLMHELCSLKYTYIFNLHHLKTGDWSDDAYRYKTIIYLHIYTGNNSKQCLVYKIFWLDI